MKKILLIIFSVISVSAFSQSTGKTTLSAEAGIPISKTADFAKFIIGGTIKHDIPASENVFVSLSLGYSSMMLKDLYYFNTPQDKTIGFVPIKVGAKYFFNPMFFGEGQLGLAFATEGKSKTHFAQSFGVGIKAAEQVELGVRYEAWTQRSGSYEQIGFRVGFSF